MHTCIQTPIPLPRWLANHTDLVQTKSSTYAARPSPGQSAGRHPVSRPQTAGDGVLRRAAETAAGKCAPQTQGRAASQQKKKWGESSGFPAPWLLCFLPPEDLSTLALPLKS